MNWRPLDHKSDALTTTPPSHPPAVKAVCSWSVCTSMCVVSVNVWSVVPHVVQPCQTLQSQSSTPAPAADQSVTGNSWLITNKLTLVGFVQTTALSSHMALCCIHHVNLLGELHCASKLCSKTKEAPKLLAVTLSNVNRFQKFFHYQTQQEICYTALCRHSTIPNVCRYTTVWKMNDQKTNEIYRVPKKQADAFLW